MIAVGRYLQRQRNAERAATGQQPEQLRFVHGEGHAWVVRLWMVGGKRACAQCLLPTALCVATLGGLCSPRLRCRHPTRFLCRRRG